MFLAVVSSESERTSNDTMALAQAAARGDAQATAQLLKRLAPDMIRSVNAILGSTHADVDDVVQHALIGLVQALPAFRGECAPKHYAARIVTRAAIAARKKSHLRLERHDTETDLDTFEVDAHSPDDHALAERRRNMVRKLLDELPEEQAETLTLRVVFGCSLPEVAATTGVPLNTVRSRVRLAKEALKRAIEKDPVLLEALEVES